MDTTLSFFLNGNPVTIENPSTETLLIDYLRSPEVHLAGPKKPCAQGGCGGCTVILSEWNEKAGKVKHRAINSCLRPLVAVNRMVVTTVEGTGAARMANAEFLTHSAISSRGGAPAEEPLIPSVLQAYQEATSKRAAVFSAIEKAPAFSPTFKPSLLLRKEIAEHPSEKTQLGMNPVAQRLAINNGTQCGYCTVGFVMNMSEFIVNNPEATKREIEDAFDGNICRCTGYRAILTGMKTFASDWTPADESFRMPCIGDDAVNSQLPASSIVIPFPDDAKFPPSGISVQDGSRIWITPLSMDDLEKAWNQHRDSSPYMVHSNTAFGIYKLNFQDARVLLDLRFIPDLHKDPDITDQHILVSAGTTYSDLIQLLDHAIKKYADRIPKDRDRETINWGAVQFMARRTAGRIVRNAATLGGNTMLVLKHIAQGTGEPFPSDLLTVLAATGSQIQYYEFSSDQDGGSDEVDYIPVLCEKIINDPTLAERIVLISYLIPFGDMDHVVLAQKVALREVNAHSIVNAGTQIWVQEKTVKGALLFFGGLLPYPFEAVETERLLNGSTLSPDIISQLIAVLGLEIIDALDKETARTAQLPYDGFTRTYKLGLAISFLIKAIINAMTELKIPVPSDIRSAGDITWGRWPVSDGFQLYETQDFKAPVSQPYIKFTAMEQASGQLHYTHELPVPPQTVNGSLVQSKKALANFYFRLPEKDEPVSTDVLRDFLSGKFDSFTDLVTSEAFKNGGINLLGMGSDQPVFTEQQVDYVGQALALACADTEQQAAHIAGYITDNCIGYTPVLMPPNGQDWWIKPVLGIDEALLYNSIYPDYPSSAPFNSHVWQITRRGSRMDWVNEKKAPIDRTIVTRDTIVDGNTCTVVESTQLAGGQAHFYMETQAAIAEPLDGGRYIVRPSSQSPMAMHSTVAMALGVQYNSIDIQIPPVGGGFGGKTEQAKFVTAAAAVAAKALKRPVRLVLTREQDMAMIGKRHPYYGQSQVAIDKGEGEGNLASKGILRGLSLKMYGDGGAFYDCSFVVSNCIITRADNAYRIANSLAQIDVCRTNTAPSTAMRAFGDIQGKLMMENAIADAAHSIGMTPEAVREKNLYERGDVTPFGQALTYCYMREVWDYLKEMCEYENKIKEIEKYNNENLYRKRGLSMIPVKYGSGYNLTMLEQAGAIVSVYQGDGSIIIHQGGVEMGQGLLTQVRQVASYILNVPMSLIEVEGAKTSTIPNPTSTGASTGTSYSAEAVKRICEQLRQVLTEFGYDMLKKNGNDWCVLQGIDFWNHGVLGWQDKPTAPHKKPLIWQNLVSMAYQNRINLTCSLSGPIVGGEAPTPNLSYKPHDQQPSIPGYQSSPNGAPGAFNAFSGFTYSAACSVVELDVLTGETKILSSDIVYDMGWSMNPAIDVGQVEGAFVQGIGYVTSEMLAFEPSGPDKGRLNSLNTWTYKPPAASSIPLELNVYLFPRNLAAIVPENPTDVLSSKEVGEPPLVLAVTVFFAIKEAVRAARMNNGINGPFRLDAPATVQEIMIACDNGIRMAGLGPV
ncbi:molybdopterin cofactor-binding domain-containing protein [Flavitalea flava]